MEEMELKKLVMLCFMAVFLTGCGTTSNVVAPDKQGSVNTTAQDSPTQSNTAQPKVAAQVQSTTSSTSVGDPVEEIKNLLQTKLGNRIDINNVTSSPNGVGVNVTFTYLEKDNQKIQQELLSLVRDLGNTNVNLSSVTLSEISPTSKKPVGSIGFIKKQLSNLTTADDATILKQADTKFFDITRE